MIFWDRAPDTSCLPAAAAPDPASFLDKEVQRDKKLMSYDIVDKGGKPMVQVEVAGDNKVRGFGSPC